MKSVLQWVQSIRSGRGNVKMPDLNGRPIGEPNLIKTNWKILQQFRESDNVDRMEIPWKTPSFVSETPTQDGMTVEELPIQAKDGTSSFARVIHNVFTEEQCAELIASINQKGFTPALMNIGKGMQIYDPNIRNGHRLLIDTPELSNYLFQRIRCFLPETLDYGGSTFQLRDLNERLRCLCYQPGNSFQMHIDGMYIRPNNGDRSLITLQLYLHEVPQDYGGATTFYPKLSRNPDKTASVSFQPKAGSVLIFTQDLPHEGSIVTNGFKYTIRTEAMYSAAK